MLFQGVGEAHGCNSDFKKEKALAFNDEFSASRRVSKLKDILSEPNLEKSQNQALASFQLKLHREPLQMQATVLEPPVLSFGSAERAVVKNGSWNLWNQQRRKTSEFNVPVQLLSFAVLDMSKDEISGKIIEDLLRVLQKHGVQIPDIGADSLKSMIANVTVRCFAANKQQIWAAFENSIARARQHFFTESNVSFAYSRTIAFFKEHGLQECLVVPHVTAHSSNLFVIPPAKVARWCYEVQCPADTTLFAPARRMYKCKVRNLREMVTLDPFDLKLENGIFKGLVEKAWLELEVVEPIYHVLIRERTSTELFDEFFALGEDQVVNPVPCYSLASKDVECPSLMFAVIPTKDVSTYAFVKYLSHVEFGIPSQVMVEESYQNQRSKTEAYCAGIALKLNTKLSNSLNRSTAWSIYSGTARQWLMDTPTMIMGYCVASGPGQDSKSIVVGTASLDVGGTHCCHDKRVQSKSHIVDSDVLEEITESLAMQFFLYNNVSPQRILVYRSGVQDGLLQDVVEYEIGAIRQAFYRLNMSDPAWSCENCKGNTLRGCVLCCPSVTFVVSQGQHDIRIVPLDGVQMNRSNNVPSGTCVTDSRAISMSSLNAVEMNSQSGMSQPESTVENTMDFLLVPQGGLKGTSRPVYYRCLLNETKLTRSLLKNLTYQFSFQYGTATKSVRNVPVLQYGVRLANTILSYLGNVPMDESKHVLHETFLPSRDENGVPDRNWVPFRPHISA
jgi:eukaryotic translation initiation factor 2C